MNWYNSKYQPLRERINLNNMENEPIGDLTTADLNKEVEIFNGKGWYIKGKLIEFHNDLKLCRVKVTAGLIRVFHYYNVRFPGKGSK